MVEGRESGPMGGNDLELAGSGFAFLEEALGMRGILCEMALLSMLEVRLGEREEKGVFVGRLVVTSLESVLELFLELRFVERRPWEETFNRELAGSAAELKGGVSVAMRAIVVDASFSCWARIMEEKKMRAPRASKK